MKKKNGFTSVFNDENQQFILGLLGSKQCKTIRFENNLFTHSNVKNIHRIGNKMVFLVDDWKL